MKLSSHTGRHCSTLALGIALVSVAGLAATLTTESAQAEPAISVYGGYNASPHSKVDYNFNLGAGAQSVTPGWDGKSFQMSPYYGVRATWWLDSSPAWGIALDYTHAKVVAKNMPADFSVLEFTDGINIFAVNVLYRYKNASSFTPYGGVGAGISVPYVEVANATNTSNTKGYQFGGFAVQALVGVDYAINENWSVFGELKTAYTQNDVDLSGGGSLSTNIISNQVLFGITYTFN